MFEIKTYVSSELFKNVLCVQNELIKLGKK